MKRADRLQEAPSDLKHPFDEAAQGNDRKLRRCERAWCGGSVPALVDALILCHKERVPIPLWLVQGLVMLIKMIFTGKTLKQRGRLGKTTTLYHSHMVDWERWEAVEELQERNEDMIRHINALSSADRGRRPQFELLAVDYSLEQRCAAIAELFSLTNNSARGSAATILRSYKLVKRNIRLGKSAQYYLPSYDNPLRGLYVPLSV